MLELDVLTIEQLGTKVYIGVLKAGELLNRFNIDRWKEKVNEEGYQRDISSTRAAKARKYLLDEEAVFPQSLLLNVRKDVKFVPSKDLDGIKTGKLFIPADEPIWVVDGQHRLAGLQLAIKEDPSYSEYPVPVSITVGFDRTKEMRQFYVINTRQKGVPTDLAEQYLVQEAERLGWERSKLIDRGIRIPAEAVKILTILDNHSGSPWLDRIQRPNETRKSSHTIRQRSFTRSLKPILSDSTLRDLKPEEIAELLIRYWSAIRDLMPDVFEHPKEYLMQKTTGTFAMHMVFPHVISKCMVSGDYSKEKMKKILTGLSCMESDFWHSMGEAGMYGTSMKSFKLIAEKINEEIAEKEPIKIQI